MGTFTRNNSSGTSVNFEINAGGDGNQREAVTVGFLAAGVPTEVDTGSNPFPVADSTTRTALGAPGDSAWSGSGSGAVVGLLKAIWTAITGTLVARPAGSIGTDHSANAASVPGSFLLATIAVNASRNGLRVQNQSTQLIQLVMDDGSGGQVSNEFLPPGSVLNGQPVGSVWSSSAFKGRLRIFCGASSSAMVMAREL